MASLEPLPQQKASHIGPKSPHDTARIQWNSRCHRANRCCGSAPPSMCRTHVATETETKVNHSQARGLPLYLFCLVLGPLGGNAFSSSTATLGNRSSAMLRGPPPLTAWESQCIEVYFAPGRPSATDRSTPHRAAQGHVPLRCAPRDTSSWRSSGSVCWAEFDSGVMALRVDAPGRPRLAVRAGACYRFASRCRSRWSVRSSPRQRLP